MENFSPDIVDIERESREKKLGRAGPLGTSVCFSRTVREKERRGRGRRRQKRKKRRKKTAEEEKTEVGEKGRAKGDGRLSLS